MVKMSLEKKIKQILRKHYFSRLLEKTLKWVEADIDEELGKVAQQIRDKRNKIQKVIDEEEAFRRRSAFHSLGKRGFSEIEMREFQLLVEELDWFLGLLVDSSTLETLEIMEDKKLMKLRTEARKKGSKSSPYEPLVEQEGEKP